MLTGLYPVCLSSNQATFWGTEYPGSRRERANLGCPWAKCLQLYPALGWTTKAWGSCSLPPTADCNSGEWQFYLLRKQTPHANWASSSTTQRLASKYDLYCGRLLQNPPVSRLHPPASSEPLHRCRGCVFLAQLGKRIRCWFEREHSWGCESRRWVIRNISFRQPFMQLPVPEESALAHFKYCMVC